MATIDPTAPSTQPAAKAAAAGATGGGFNDLDMGQFLQLLITEMQNQDPMDPMKNSEMLQQVGQIREIGATNQLTETLSKLSSSQELVTASGLIGKQVKGLADDTTEVSGVVDRISVETSEGGARKVKVQVGGKTMSVGNIREIQTV